MPESAHSSLQPTPWSLFARHAGQPFAVLLDRSAAGPSFAASSPASVLIVDHSGTSHEWTDGLWKVHDDDPLAVIGDYVERCASTAKLSNPAFATGCALPRTVGYLSYEIARFLERGPITRPDPSGLPLAMLCTYDRADGWDPSDSTMFSIEFERRSRPAATQPHLEPLLANPSMRESDPREHYQRAFSTIRNAIAAGDIYQANLSRRIWVDQLEPSATIYRRLRNAQPVPRGGFVDAGAFQILSNSPETFLSVDGSSIETFPIKGTRARASDTRGDEELIAELRADPKELAEHVMIVDLERNDLGRVCRTGSVAVAAYARPRTFKTVHHLESEVRGTLMPDTSVADILRACFPGGSITGAPKIRSMEIISDVESSARGVYTGAIGCFNGQRSFDLNVAIRTAVCRDGRIVYSTGGGIVADSSAAREIEETNTKALAFYSSLSSNDLRAALAS